MLSELQIVQLRRVELEHTLARVVIVRAQRFETVGGLRGEMPANRFLAIYEFEADDPAVAMADLRKAMRTMHIDPSLDMDKIVAFGYAERGPAVEAP